PAETLVWYDVPVTEMTVNGKNYVENADNTKTPIAGLYHQEKFATRDKYAAFLYGNNGLTVIKSENNLNKQEGKTSRLLLIKDSYSNCLTPFLTYSYDELYVVDLRGLTQKLSQLIATTEFDDIFLLYNYESFESDRNITRLVF
ncbi:MAG: DHHW family protein, partial [Angelakisella sp.]